MSGYRELKDPMATCLSVESKKKSLTHGLIATIIDIQDFFFVAEV